LRVVTRPLAFPVIAHQWRSCADGLAAYSCGVSSGIAAQARRTGFPVAPDQNSIGDRERHI
jgi:hypothetical protein